MQRTTHAWIARSADSAVTLVMLHDDGAYRLITSRRDPSVLHGGALVRTLSKHTSETAALRRADRWIRSHNGYRFSVEQPAPSELPNLLRVAQLRVLPTDQADLNVLGRWSFDSGGTEMHVVVAADGGDIAMLRIEEPGFVPRLMVVYPNHKIAIHAARTWMSGGGEEATVTFSAIVNPTEA